MGRQSCEAFSRFLRLFAAMSLLCSSRSAEFLAGGGVHYLELLEVERRVGAET
jgi:hypothetical protein